MTYHLHTENLPNVPLIVSRHFPSFTCTIATGYWHGTVEPAAIIEIVTSNVAAITALAADLRSTNRQEAVLIEALPSTETLSTALPPVTADSPTAEHGTYDPTRLV